MNRHHLLLLGCCLLATLSGFGKNNEQKAASKQHVLKYSRPAQTWVEALPIGNGRLGAMVFGNPASDRIQLNEETIWGGRPNNNYNKEAKEWIPKIQQLIWEGKYQEAEKEANAHVMPLNSNSGMPFQTFGDLYIDFPNQSDYKSYYRELSVDSARAITCFEHGGVTYKREYISSFASDVIAIRLSASKPGMITCNLKLTSPHPEVAISSEGNEIVLSGTGSNHEGQKGKVTFTGRATATLVNGNIKSRDGVISIANADEATVYVSIATNFNRYDDISGNDTIKSEEILQKALTQSYASMKQKHTDVYQQYFNRVVLSLGDDDYQQ